MLEKTGIPSPAQIESVFPNDNRLNAGPVAIIECFQAIPCNPCATSCPRQAIQPFVDINDIPVIDNDKCNGCGLCIMKCPGLAIMVVDMSWSDSRALVRIPYEFRPLPKEKEIVYALDRAGAVVGDAEVVKVYVPANKTAIVSIAVDKQHIKDVRNIRLKRTDVGIVCRCSDITVDDIRDIISQGCTTVDEIKRFTRLGMGPCQGRTCIPIVMQELANALNKPMAGFCPGTKRPVVKSIKLGDLAAYSSEEQGDK